MFKDITLGQYYQTDSLLHRLDPRIKLTGTLVFIISLFIANSFTGYLLAAVFLITMIRLSNVPFSYIIRGMRAILFILFITMAFNLFLTPGEVLVKFGIFKITREGIYFAVRMAIRLIFLIIGSSLMDKIMKAQMARGADFESRNLIKKVRSLIPILVPLFVSAFRRANDLAMAMEARCYRGGEGRTKMKPLVYQKRDRIAQLILLLFFAATIGIRAAGHWVPVI